MQIDKQISEDWLASNEFLINEEVITILDYYIVTTCTDKPISEVEWETARQNLLCEQVAMYKALDG